jgi:integrase
VSDDALDTILGTPRHVTPPFVFWRGDRDRYTTLSGLFRRIAARAEAPLRCHDLRHPFSALEFARRTGDIAALQAILGHTAMP